MKLSAHLFRHPSNKLVALFGLLALIGFIDASYLTLKYFLGGPIPCFVASGCDTVTTSVYARMIGIPVALLGAFYYLAILVLLVAFFDSRWIFPFFVASYATILGFVMSLWFVFVQAFLLKAFCFYCLISATTSTLLFLGNVWWRRTHRIPEEV